MTSHSYERAALRLCVALAASLPIVAGAWDVTQGLAGAWAANHDRYLAGLLLAIGLGFWSCVSGIERKGERFRLLTTLVLIGGTCRLLGVALGDEPTGRVAAALAMELIVTPLLCLWQMRIAAFPPHRARTLVHGSA